MTQDPTYDNPYQMVSTTKAMPKIGKVVQSVSYPTRDQRMGGKTIPPEQSSAERIESWVEFKTYTTGYDLDHPMDADLYIKALAATTWATLEQDRITLIRGLSSDERCLATDSIIGRFTDMIRAMICDHWEMHTSYRVDVFISTETHPQAFFEVQRIPPQYRMSAILTIAVNALVRMHEWYIEDYETTLPLRALLAAAERFNPEHIPSNDDEAMAFEEFYGTGFVNFYTTEHLLYVNNKYDYDVSYGEIPLHSLTGNNNHKRDYAARPVRMHTYEKGVMNSFNEFELEEYVWTANFIPDMEGYIEDGSFTEKEAKEMRQLITAFKGEPRKDIAEDIGNIMIHMLDEIVYNHAVDMQEVIDDLEAGEQSENETNTITDSKFDDDWFFNAGPPKSSDAEKFVDEGYATREEDHEPDFDEELAIDLETDLDFDEELSVKFQELLDYDLFDEAVMCLLTERLYQEKLIRNEVNKDDSNLMANICIIEELCRQAKADFYAKPGYPSMDYFRKIGATAMRSMEEHGCEPRPLTRSMFFPKKD